MDGGGRTVIAPGVVANITGTGTNINTPRIFDNFGTTSMVNPVNSNTGLGGNGTLDNEPGASFSATDNSVFNQDIIVSIKNMGTFSKAGIGNTGIGGAPSFTTTVL